MRRLTKVQRYLKQKGIRYAYGQSRNCGEIYFKANGNIVSIGEFTGNKGDTVMGIMVDGREVSTQEDVIKILENIIK